MAQIQIEGDFLASSFSILEEQPMDMLLGKQEIPTAVQSNRNSVTIVYRVNVPMLFLAGLRIRITLMRIRIQLCFFMWNADPDPDPAFYFNADLDPAPDQRDANLRTQGYRTSRTLFLSLQDSIVSVQRPSTAPFISSLKSS